MSNVSSVRIFCNKLGVSEQMRKAFTTYVRTVESKKYMLDGEGETIHLMISRMGEEELAAHWVKFRKELQMYQDEA